MTISFWGGVDSAVCSVAACKTDDSNKWESMYIREFRAAIPLICCMKDLPNSSVMALSTDPHWSLEVDWQHVECMEV